MDLVRGSKEDLVDCFEALLDKVVLSPAILGLCGGRSVVPFLESLSQRSWEPGTHAFLADERCLPLGDPELNTAILEPHLFSKNTTLRPMPFLYNATCAEQTLKDYQDSFTALGGQFDLLILGAGEDGHIASLFPHHQALQVNDTAYCYVDHSPKPPPLRISITTPLIVEAKCLVLLFLGEGKRNAFDAFLDPRISSDLIPAKLALLSSDLHVFTDL